MTELAEEYKSVFSLVSILLKSMIFIVVLVIAYINRKLLISKFKLHCIRNTKEIKKPCSHEDSMVAANQSVKKIQESYQVNHEEILLKNILHPEKSNLKQEINNISNIFSVNSIEIGSDGKKMPGGDVSHVSSLTIVN